MARNQYLAVRVTAEEEGLPPTGPVLRQLWVEVPA